VVRTRRRPRLTLEKFVSFSGVPRRGKANGCGRTDGRARRAVDALGALPFLVGIGVGLRLTVLGAEAAVDAFFFIDPDLEQVPAREKAEQCPGRTEIAAPEPFLHGVQGHSAQEDQPDAEGLVEGRVEGQVLQELGERPGDRGQAEPVDETRRGPRGRGQAG